MRGMDLHFLGAATTVTGSQFLLETGQARILVDCGMFQGGPNESIRNRIPLAYDPATLDAILLTHAHLDHCGLIPHVVREGFHGPIRATAGTIELARLVLLDSGRLQEEFSKREDRWERRHPDRAEAEDTRDRAALEAAIELAESGEEGLAPTPAAAAFAAGSREIVDDAPAEPAPATSAPTSVPAPAHGGPAEPVQPSRRPSRRRRRRSPPGRSATHAKRRTRKAPTSPRRSNRSVVPVGRTARQTCGPPDTC